MRKTRLAVFASGSGSNYEAIAEACRDGRLDAEIVLLVCDKPGAKVLERAKRYGTESFAFTPKDYASREAYETVLASMLDERGVDYVCLAGYMRIVGKVYPKLRIFFRKNFHQFTMEAGICHQRCRYPQRSRTIL